MYKLAIICTHPHTDQQQTGQVISHTSYRNVHNTPKVTVWPIFLGALKKVTVRATSELGWKQGNM